MIPLHPAQLNQYLTREIVFGHKEDSPPADVAGKIYPALSVSAIDNTPDAFTS